MELYFGILNSDSKSNNFQKMLKKKVVRFVLHTHTLYAYVQFLLGSYWVLTGFLLGSYWVLLGSYWVLTGSYWVLTGFLLGSYWVLTGFLLGSYWVLLTSTAIVQLALNFSSCFLYRS